MSVREFKLRCPKAHAVWMPADSIWGWTPLPCGFVKNGKKCGRTMVHTGVYRWTR